MSEVSAADFSLQNSSCIGPPIARKDSVANGAVLANILFPGFDLLQQIEAVRDFVGIPGIGKLVDELFELGDNY